MTRAATLALALLASLAVAAPAGAQSTGALFTTFGPTTGGKLIQAPVTINGSISVEFHGSEAAGCAALGRCGLSGTEVFDPGHQGELSLESIRLHGTRKLLGALALGVDRPATTTTRTQRDTGTGQPGVCADANSSPFAGGLLSSQPADSLSIRVGSSPLGLLGDDLLNTHCPGPLQSDLLPLLPSRRFPRSFLKHGGSMDLSTTRSFTAAGFEGTLRSTLVLRFSRAGKAEFFNIPITGSGAHRFHTVLVVYRVERVSGSVGVAFSGLGDPAQCLALDACGASGTITETPAATGGLFALSTVVPASRAGRDVHTLLGLARGGRTAHLFAFAGGSWTSRNGTVTGSSAWSSGATCTDGVRLRTGALAGSLDPSFFRLAYSPTGTDDSLHTRCGGPLQSDVAPNGALASTVAPASVLRHRVVTLHLTHPATVIPTSGYSASIRAGITVTLRRVAVHESTLSLPF